MKASPRTEFNRANLGARCLAALGLLLAFPVAPCAVAQQKQKTESKKGPLLPAAKDATRESVDEVLSTMSSELERSKSRLKMENVATPYYIDYRISELDEYDAEAAFGALRQSQRTHTRSVRVVVRVGDYKQDSYYGAGTGVTEIAPLDNSRVAISRALWLATDRAYKEASEALAAKKALLSQFTADQPFDDFANAPRVESLGPLVKLEFEEKPWKETLERSSALFRTAPEIQSLSASLRFRAVNEYFMNTEGTATRQGYTIYSLILGGSAQAADGMKLERSPYYVAAKLSELPAPDKIISDARKMVETLVALRNAPIVDEEYSGPVLFSNDAASDVFAGMIGANIVGRRPKPGESARVEGKFAASYKSRVLPDFLTVIDDPNMKTYLGQTLVGAYEIDEEGVRAATVPLVRSGELINYLLGREPIRDFPESNGHGRAAPGQPPLPNVSNLLVLAKPASSPEEMKNKLLQMCRDRGKSYAYRAETLGPGYNPRLLYRVYEKDGHEELVRGAVFNELDTRTLRNDVVAAGDDSLVNNREGAIPTTVIVPSILIDALEVKRNNAKNVKLPAFPPPSLTISP
jgi:TldD protein